MTTETEQEEGPQRIIESYFNAEKQVVLLKRLRNPPFGTETSDRHLMTAAAEVIEGLRTAAMAMMDDYQTSESHHPNHVLVPLGAFNDLRTALGLTINSKQLSQGQSDD